MSYSRVHSELPPGFHFCFVGSGRVFLAAGGTLFNGCNWTPPQATIFLTNPVEQTAIIPLRNNN